MDKSGATKLGMFGWFVGAVNRRPILWTIGLMVPVYILALALAFMAFGPPQTLFHPSFNILALSAAAIMVMSYHWFFSRYQTSSVFAQCLQFFAGLIPIVGGFLIFVALVTMG